MLYIAWQGTHVYYYAIDSRRTVMQFVNNPYTDHCVATDHFSGPYVERSISSVSLCVYVVRTTTIELNDL